MNELFTCKRQFVVQAKDTARGWYDFAMWRERVEAESDLASLRKSRANADYRLVERLTVDIAQGEDL